MEIGWCDIMVTISSGLVKDNSASSSSHLFSSSTNCRTDNKKEHLASHVVRDRDNLSGSNGRSRLATFRGRRVRSRRYP